MKNILICTIATLFSIGVFAQETPSMTKAQAQEILPTLEKEIDKLKKSIAKNENSILKSEASIKIDELKLEENKDFQEGKLMEIEAGKQEIVGLDLGALEDKIKRLEGEKKKLESDNDRGLKAISKKRGEIQKLESDIDQIEVAISTNKSYISEKDGEIAYTNSTIESNGLGAKEDAIKSKKSELKKMVGEEKKVSGSIVKSKGTIEKAKLLIAQTRSELDAKEAKLAELKKIIASQ